MSAQKSQAIVRRIADEIRRGEHGDTGSAFMTVREICDEFGVSLVTAQRIVNQLKTAGLLSRSGKRLNIAARQFTPSGPRRAGGLVTNIDNPFFSRLLNAVELAGRRRGIEIISAGSNYDPDHEARQLEMLAGSGADGFLICPAHDSKSAPVLNALKLPFVLVGRRVAGVDADVVMVNDFEAGRMAAAHLFEQGCRDFIYLGISHFLDDMRGRGFSFELHERGIALGPERCVWVNLAGDDNTLPGRVRELCGGRRTGVFCYHDLLALRMLRAARLCGLEIPREVSIVGVDDLPAAAEAFPSLSSISYPIQQIAENALEMLLRRSERSFAGAGAVNYLDPSLVIRESSHEIPGGPAVSQGRRII